MELEEIRDVLRQFVAERGWQKFHTPKNLASALSVEASELLEPFQWLESGETAELSADQLTAIRHEMADVLAYLVLLADRLDIDLHHATLEKIEINRIKYPAAKVYGRSKKYSEYGD
ncbi:nucleotide pyrophosphohydrolase [Burkholderia cenocepacia]|uniref:nucleotide pyrophosphohydrolase n=1 Tax=Burkholderia cenocepacia TaxID=95486 RepID=UPI001B9D7CF2|nr:nucleotide pyrophosphohydrolase [Burkholderia cenocepacia]MBR8074614.1 nucleotide pyrophosphohydrolase [Burkholderia cenocepacia]MBR8449402.1 nucleotide pyrophosphohydrolase [Burkholderia cenocepacia]